MPLTTGQFNDLVSNSIIQWEQARKEFPSVRQELATIVPSATKTNVFSSLSTVKTARRRDEGDDAYKSDLTQGYSKTFTQAEIALQVDVTKQLRMFDKYDEIMRRMREMARSAERRVELDIASLLSFAWSSTYANLDGETVTVTTPDGLSLINTAHTANGSSNTFSNEISTTHDAISPDTLEALEEKFNSFIDDTDGRRVPCRPDTIITGEHAPTVHTVRRMLNSELLAGTANNDTNTFKSAYKHLIVPFIDMTHSTEARNSSKIRYCFVAKLQDKDYNGFRLEVSQDMKFEAPEQVFESSTWEFLTTMLYDFGTTKANFIAGTKGDGTAV
jgi:phage major head subunit gpT-like protein